MCAVYIAYDNLYDALQSCRIPPRRQWKEPMQDMKVPLHGGWWSFDHVWSLFATRVLIQHKQTTWTKHDKTSCNSASICTFIYLLPVTCLIPTIRCDNVYGITAPWPFQHTQRKKTSEFISPATLGGFQLQWVYSSTHLAPKENKPSSCCWWKKSG